MDIQQLEVKQQYIKINQYSSGHVKHLQVMNKIVRC